MRHRKLDPLSDASYPILNSALSRQMDSILAQVWHDSEGQGFPVLLDAEQHRAVRAPVRYAAKKSIMSKSCAGAVLSRAPLLHKTPQLENLEGAHHVVVPVLEDMAVPHVLAGDIEVRPDAQGFSDNDAGTLVAGEYSASTAEGNSIGASTAVIDYAVGKSMDLGARYFDFGRRPDTQ
jgi:hypothetical protein